MNEIIQINENTWRIENDGVRVFLLTGTKEALLIDTGMTLTNAREIEESITKLPLRLLNTHTDIDHISGNAAFESVMMGAGEEEFYRSRDRNEDVIPLYHGDIIDLGERELEIMDLAGHTPGSIAILDKEHRVLISGDSIQDGRIYMFGAHRNMEKYIETMEALEKQADRFDEIYPSHSTFPVKTDLIPKLVEGAKQILAGEAQGTETEVHGNTIMLYQFTYAGFLCEK